MATMRTATLELLERAKLPTEQALALAANDAPDLILMDLGLPGMDGLEAVTRLRATPATRRAR